MDWYELLPKILNMSLTASVIIVTVLILRVLLRRHPGYIPICYGQLYCFVCLPYRYKYSLIGIGLFDTPIVETTDSVSQVAYIPNNIVHTENPEVTLPVPVLDNAVIMCCHKGRNSL